LEGQTIFTAYFLGLPLDSEDGGNKFLRNLDKLSPDYAASIHITASVILNITLRPTSGVQRMSNIRFLRCLLLLLNINGID
jgi:hypothetical protein